MSASHHAMNCGARNRSGFPCAAKGQGNGGRCRHHGGTGNGHYPLVLIASKRGSFRDSRWNCLVINGACFNRVQRACMALGASEGSVRQALRRLPPSKHRSRTAKTWPQPIGYRIAQLMLERGRVEFVVLDGVKREPQALLDLMPCRSTKR